MDKQTVIYRIIAMAACTVIFVCAVVLPIFSLSGSEEEDIPTSQPVSEPALQQTPTPRPTPSPSPSPMPEETPPTAPSYSIFHPSDREIDFDALLDINDDVIAWLNVPGTDIDYPVLISHDNYDYLERDINGRRNAAGEIFADMSSDRQLRDRVVVLYGHNMRNGTMFAGLHQFESPEFFENNRTIKLYTPEGMRIYEIICAYATDHRNILYEKDYSDDATWFAYIDKIFSNNDPQANLQITEIGTDDQILTLSTCVSGVFEQRYVIQGLLVKYWD